MYNRIKETELQKKFRLQVDLDNNNYPDEDYLQKNWQGRNCIHIASSFGGLEHIPKSCLTIENIILPDNYGDTALHLAAKSGNLKLFDLDNVPARLFNIKNKAGLTPYDIADSRGFNDQIPQKILNEQPLYKLNTIINWAKNADTEKLPLFLQDIEEWIDQKYHHILAKMGKLHLLPNHLLNDQALTKVYKDDQTPLSLAIVNGDINAILIEKIHENTWRQYINPCSKSTYMHLISKHGKIHLLPDYLLTKEYIFCEDEDGNTPITISIKHSNFSLIINKIINEIDWRKELNLPTRPTYCHIFALHNFLHYAPKSILKNDNLLKEDKNGNTPLSITILNGQLPNIIRLIEGPINWEQRISSQKNKTHYHIVAEFGQIGLIEKIPAEDYFLKYYDSDRLIRRSEKSVLDILWENNQFDLVPPIIRWKNANYFDDESRKIIESRAINFLPENFDWSKAYQNNDYPICYAARKGVICLLDKSLLNERNLSVISSIERMNAADIACYNGYVDTIPREFRHLATNYIEKNVKKSIQDRSLKNLPEWMLEIECLDYFLHEIAAAGLYSSLPDHYNQPSILQKRCRDKYNTILHTLINSCQGNTVSNNLFFNTEILNIENSAGQSVYHLAAERPNMGGFPAALFTRDILNINLQSNNLYCKRPSRLWADGYYDSGNIPHEYDLMPTDPVIADLIFINHNSSLIPHHLMLLSYLYKKKYLHEKNLIKRNSVDCIERQTEKIITPVVGIRYDNRLDVVKNLSINDSVRLIRDPYNKFDSNAITVSDINGFCIGFLPKELALKLHKRFDDYGGEIVGEIEYLNVSSADQRSNTLIISFALHTNSENYPRRCTLDECDNIADDIIEPGILLSDNMGRFFITRLNVNRTACVIYENGSEKIHSYRYLENLLEIFKESKILHIKDMAFIFEYFNLITFDSPFQKYDFLISSGIIRTNVSQKKLIKNTASIRRDLVNMRKKAVEEPDLGFLLKCEIPKTIYSIDDIIKSSLCYKKYIRHRAIFIWFSPSILTFLITIIAMLRNPHREDLIYCIIGSLIVSVLVLIALSIPIAFLCNFLSRCFDCVFCSSEMCENIKMIDQVVNYEADLIKFMKNKVNELQSLLDKRMLFNNMYVTQLCDYTMMRCVSPWDYKVGTCYQTMKKKYLNKTFVISEKINDWQSLVWDAFLNNNSVEINDFSRVISITVKTLYGIDLQKLSNNR